MSKLITITYEGEEKKYPVGTTLFEISKDYNKNYKYPILISEVDNDIRELSDEMLKGGSVKFQPVLLTGMVCLHQFQLRYLNIEIHFFFYVGITCGKCLDFCIGKCRFVHILTASHRGFAGHDLSDEFLFILDELPRITVKRTFRNITKYLDLIILVALS